MKVDDHVDHVNGKNNK